MSSIAGRMSSPCVALNSAFNRRSDSISSVDKRLPPLEASDSTQSAIVRNSETGLHPASQEPPNPETSYIRITPMMEFGIANPAA